MGRTLCIYAFHEYNLNVEFFIKHGLVDDPTVDFYFVVNDPQFKLEVPEATVVNRENKNFDFGGWSHVLLTNDLYKNYDYFIFLNSSVRGPFYPDWYKERNWVKLFTNRITDDLKLFGILIGNEDGRPHVQSMVLVTDRVGLDIGIEGGVFKLNEPPLTMQDVIYQKEIGYSSLIMQRGYNIGCMLAALRGTDFRKKKIPIKMLFEENNYHGTSIHPYETIFCKVTNRLLRVSRNLRLVDLYTNWADESPQDAGRYFDATQYLLENPDLPEAGVKTSQGAELHFNHYGFYESRAPRLEQTFVYKVDLSPAKMSGLVNQLYSLVNAILISHYVGRSLVIPGFYPQYNSGAMVRLSKIINLPRLNQLLAKLNLSTYVLEPDAFHPWLKRMIETCPRSRYADPTQATFNAYGFLGTLIRLKSERERMLNLNGTFSGTMFFENSDPEIRQLAVDLLLGIEFAYPFNEVVKEVKTTLGLSDYKVVHLRLEDDMLAHKSSLSGTDLMEVGMTAYSKYKERLALFAKPDDKIFVSTHLTKSDHKMNYVVAELQKDYPNLVLTSAWREKFPTFQVGREIDAIVDYLVCLGGVSFLGWTAATFTNILLYSYRAKGKLAYTIDDPPHLFTPLDLPFTILSSKVSHGTLGLAGRLGYESDGVTTVDRPGFEIISAHAPSTVVIKTLRPIGLRGSCSSTSRIVPRLTFLCNGRIIGEVNQVQRETPEVRLEPGTYTLQIETSTSDWAHSIWLLD